MRRFSTILAATILGVMPVFAMAQDSTPASTPEPVHERCVAANTLPLSEDVTTLPNPDTPENEQLIADIEYGLHTGVTISDVWAVQSDDFPSGEVWFVSAQLHGGALDEDVYTATWATSRINEDGEYQTDGMLFSVDGFANEFSDWGDGGKTAAKLSMGDDGAEDSADCALGHD